MGEAAASVAWMVSLAKMDLQSSIFLYSRYVKVTSMTKSVLPAPLWVMYVYWIYTVYNEILSQCWVIALQSQPSCFFLMVVNQSFGSSQWWVGNEVLWPLLKWVIPIVVVRKLMSKSECVMILSHHWSINEDKHLLLAKSSREALDPFNGGKIVVTRDVYHALSKFTIDYHWVNYHDNDSVSWYIILIRVLKVALLAIWTIFIIVVPQYIKAIKVANAMRGINTHKL